MTAEAIATALGGVRSGKGFKCLCPAHGDKHPSLNVTPSEDGLLVHCFAGCSQESVIAALRQRGLWPESPTSRLSSMTAL